MSSRSTLPDFVTEQMSHKQLLIAACNKIKENFELMAISVYLKGHQKTDFMDFVLIVHGMQDSENYLILNNLLSLWGYYVTLQEESSAAGLQDLMEIAAGNERYSNVFGIFLDTCESLSILKAGDKKTLREMLEAKENFRLSLLRLKYLYEIDSETLKKILSMRESLWDNLGCYERGAQISISLFGYLFIRYMNEKIN